MAESTNFSTSSGAPTLPSAEAAAARTPSSPSCSAFCNSRTAERPSRMPSAKAAWRRTLGSASLSRRARPSYTAWSAGVWSGNAARSSSSEKTSRKRSTAPPRSRSVYSSTSVVTTSSRILGSPSPSDVARVGTADRSRSWRSARTISSRTFGSGSRTRPARGATASRRRLRPNSAAASSRVLTLGLLRLATRSSKAGRVSATSPPATPAVRASRTQVDLRMLLPNRPAAFSAGPPARAATPGAARPPARR